jgi:flagella basal body P-ring formation protein FlgA
MIYRFGRLEINAWGRALDEGGEGDVITIMNLESRKRIQGTILPTGVIEVHA